MGEGGRPSLRLVYKHIQRVLLPCKSFLSTRPQDLTPGWEAICSELWVTAEETGPERGRDEAEVSGALGGMPALPGSAAPSSAALGWARAA